MDNLRSPGLDSYYLFHAARADLLRRLGRDEEAAAAYATARAHTTNPVEQAFLDMRRGALRPMRQVEVLSGSSMRRHPSRGTRAGTGHTAPDRT